MLGQEKKKGGRMVKPQIFKRSADGREREPLGERAAAGPKAPFHRGGGRNRNL